MIRLAFLASLLVGSVLVASPVRAASSCAVLQLGGLSASEAQTLLPQFAADHACGFLLDHRTAAFGQDDILNGGTISTEGTAYPAYLAQLQALPVGPVTQNYVRLNWDVYAASHPVGFKYKFDIFDQTQLRQFDQTWLQQATLARDAGLRGIWLDAEPYDYPDMWNEGADTTMPASSHTPQQVAQQYYLLGRIAETQMLAAYPNIQLVLMPGFAFTVSNYVHYPDFYAGMISVAQAHQANGFVLATESTTGVDTVTNATLLGYLSNYELGTQANGGRYSPVRTVLQQYDATNGTTFWPWHLAHSNVSIELWPYRDANNNPNAATPDLRMTLEDLGTTLQQALSLSPQYVSIYSEERTSWEQASYACYAHWTSATPPTDLVAYPLLSSGTQPCPGWQMAHSIVG